MCDSLWPTSSPNFKFSVIFSLSSGESGLREGLVIMSKAKKRPIIQSDSEDSDGSENLDQVAHSQHKKTLPY